MDKQTEEQLEVFSHYLTEDPTSSWFGCFVAFGGAAVVMALIIAAIVLHG